MSPVTGLPFGGARRCVTSRCGARRRRSTGRGTAPSCHRGPARFRGRSGPGRPRRWRPAGRRCAAWIAAASAGMPWRRARVERRA